MTLGQKLKRIRESKNFTQEYVARQIGITQQAYQKIEIDETKIDTEKFGKLVAVLDVSINDFVGWDGNIFNNCNQKENYFNCEINRSQEIERELHLKLNAEKDKVIETQKESIILLQKTIELLQKQITKT